MGQEIYGIEWRAIVEKRLNELQDRDRRLVSDFCEYNRAKKKTSEIRLAKLVYHLKLWRRFLPDKDYLDMDKADILAGVLKLDKAKTESGKELSANTTRDYKKVIRVFFKFLRGTDSPPPEVSWIECKTKKSDEGVPPETLDEKDLEKMLAVCEDPKERAFLAMLFETGCRIGELLPIQLKNIVREERGYRLKMTGKTGFREPLVSMAVPYLTQWLSHHVRKDDPDAWLFYTTKRGDFRLWKYNAARKRVNDIVARAGITKKHNLHFFRASSATFKKRHGWDITDIYAYHGWVHGSKEAGKYFKNTARDADAAVLRTSGDTSPSEEKLEPVCSKVCHACKTKNGFHATRCITCGAPLLGMEKEEREMVKAELRMALKKLLKEEPELLDALRS